MGGFWRHQYHSWVQSSVVKYRYDQKTTRRTYKTHIKHISTHIRSEFDFIWKCCSAPLQFGSYQDWEWLLQQLFQVTSPGFQAEDKVAGVDWAVEDRKQSSDCERHQNISQLPSSLHLKNVPKCQRDVSPEVYLTHMVWMLCGFCFPLIQCCCFSLIILFTYCLHLRWIK